MRPRARQVNFDVTDITDPLIRINSGQTGANDKDIGIVFERGSDTNVAVIWDESADELVVINTTEDGSTGGNVTISSYANIRANAFYGDGSNLTGVTNYGDSDVAAYLSANGYGTSSSIIASITDSAPTTLDTLNELAAALGDDANFSTTITNSIATKWTQDNTKISNWDTAYSWGNHASAGYLTSETSHSDVLVDGDFITSGIMSTNGSGTYSIITDNSSNWNTAFGWGNHASEGYITSYTVTQADVTTHQAALSITESQISDLGSYLVASDIASKANLASPTFTGTPAAPTAAAGTNTTQIATTAFVGTAVSNLVDSAPGTLNTLNELAAALGDDPNFATTVTTSIATKLPLAGGQMTGNITFSGTQTVDGRDLSVDGAKLDGIESGATADQNKADIDALGIDAATLDGLDSTQFLRSDADDVTSGQLTVNKATTYDTAGNLVVYGTGKNSIIVQTSDNTLDRGIAFRNSGGAYLSYINMADRGSNTADMVFGVNNGTSTDVDTVTERMRITKEGNIVSAGGEFQGRATSAEYADLAEKYTTDQEYPIGTAMCVGGEAETTAAGSDCIAIGVISDKPAYLMNSKIDGQAIGLKGRVPVRVKGAVRKGQAVYAWADGVCSTVATMGMIGVALESNDNEEEKLIECVLKV